MTGMDKSRVSELCAPNLLQTDTITYFLNPEGAETFPDLVMRARRLLVKMETMNLEGDILLVTHGDFGKMIYAAYYDLDWQDVLHQFHFGNSELLLLAPDSVAEEAHVVTIPQFNS